MGSPRVTLYRRVAGWQRLDVLPFVFLYAAAHCAAWRAVSRRGATGDSDGLARGCVIAALFSSVCVCVCVCGCV